jgi:hypothetical protein
MGFCALYSVFLAYSEVETCCAATAGQRLHLEQRGGLSELQRVASQAWAVPETAPAMERPMLHECEHDVMGFCALYCVFLAFSEAERCSAATAGQRLQLDQREGVLFRSYRGWPAKHGQSLKPCQRWRGKCQRSVSITYYAVVIVLCFLGIFRS